MVIRILLVWLGWLCVLGGVALIALDLVRSVVRIPLAQQPNPGTGLLMATTGLIAIHLARSENRR